jgi:hypothetical protein
MTEYIYDKTATREANQFMWLRHVVWQIAVGPELRTLAEAQADMDRWDVLLAFHLFTAAVLRAGGIAPGRNAYPMSVLEALSPFWDIWETAP